MGTTYNKAIIGAAVAGLGVIFTALADNGISSQEWIGAAIAAVAALGGIYQTPNKPAK